MTATRALALLSVLALVGCGRYVDTPPGQSVDVSGKVTAAAAKGNFAGLRIAFLPTGGSGQQVFFVLKPDGSFSGKMNAGPYTYFLEATGTNEAAADKLPKEYRTGSKDRNIEVKGGELAVNF